MGTLEFRLLRADEIDVRVAQINERGCGLLLYKDARVDMSILDETVGAYNWTRRHDVVNGNLYCTVCIFDADKGEWVGKSDCGVESAAEKEKGEASDSFKRACVNWGIGRVLYTAPHIWVPADKAGIVKGRNGKPATYDRFYVEKILYDDNRRIQALSIKSDKRGRVFVWQSGGVTCAA